MINGSRNDRAGQREIRIAGSPLHRQHAAGIKIGIARSTRSSPAADYGGAEHRTAASRAVSVGWIPSMRA